MRNAISRLTRMAVVAVAVLGPLAADVLACPMCRENLQENPALPRAYMASILFMLAMPATLLTGFGVGFYRLSKQGTVPPVEESSDDADDDTAVA